MEDAGKIFQELAANLSNDELKELVQQEINKNSYSGDSEKEQKELLMAFVKRKTNLSAYEQLEMKRKRKTQPAFDNFLSLRILFLLIISVINPPYHTRTNRSTPFLYKESLQKGTSRGKESQT